MSDVLNDLDAGHESPTHAEEDATSAPSLEAPTSEASEATSTTAATGDAADAASKVREAGEFVEDDDDDEEDDDEDGDSRRRASGGDDTTSVTQAAAAAAAGSSSSLSSSAASSSAAPASASSSSRKRARDDDDEEHQSSRHSRERSHERQRVGPRAPGDERKRARTSAESADGAPASSPLRRRARSRSRSRSRSRGRHRDRSYADPAEVPGTGHTERPTYNMYVGNVGPEMTRERLFELMSDCAGVADVTVVEDRETQRSKPFAFVHFASEEALTDALNRHEALNMDGRILRLTRAQPRCTIYVGRIPADAEPAKMVQLLEESGGEALEKLVWKQAFAFAHYVNLQVAQRAMERFNALGSVKYGDSDLRISFARSKNNERRHDSGSRDYPRDYSRDYSRDSRRGGRHRAAPMTTLFVRGLQQGTSPEDLEAAFRVCPGVIAARIGNNRRDPTRPFGFVEFSSSSDARLAKDTMDGSRVGYDTIQVDFAKDRSSSRSDSSYDRRPRSSHSSSSYYGQQGASGYGQAPVAYGAPAAYSGYGGYPPAAAPYGAPAAYGAYGSYGANYANYPNAAMPNAYGNPYAQGGYGMPQQPSRRGRSRSRDRDRRS